MILTQLFTPGIDSFISNWMLLKNEKYKNYKKYKIYFDIGSRYSQYEIDFLRSWYGKDVIIQKGLDLGDIEDEEAYIPNRNMLLVTMAQSITDADVITLNGNADDEIPDNTSKFRNQLSDILKISCGKNVDVISPICDLEKGEAVNYFSKNCNPENFLDILNKSYSCYCEDLYEEECLPYFSVDKTGSSFVEIGKTNIYGCMSCKACYRKMCALTDADLYVPFYDYSLCKNYDINRYKTLYPNRYKTMKNYDRFLKWFGCD